jgi:hypothetical protein
MTDDALLDDHRTRRRAREDIMLKFNELSWQDQYKVYEVIQGYFFHFGPRADALDELRKRAECVTAVQGAAKHLGLPEGEMPGVQQYERARKELGMELSAWTIERRWEAWSEVCKAARGERVRMSAPQRALLRTAKGYKTKGEEWVAGVREWLESAPTYLRCDDYDAWAEARNKEKPDLPPARKTSNIRSALGLTWKETIRVARRDLSLAEAHARRKKKLKRESGGFASLRGVAAIRGLTLSQAQNYVRADRTFPAHVFTLHGAHVWHWDDVEAHHQGKPFPKRKRGEMQGEVVDSDHIMRLCGLTDRELYPAISRRSPEIPRPAGCVFRYFWLRAEVEAWSEQRRAA